MTKRKTKPRTSQEKPAQENSASEPHFSSGPEGKPENPSNSIPQTTKDAENDLKKKYDAIRNNVSEGVSKLFDSWEAKIPESDFDVEVDVDVDSLEAAVGYSSLYRQMHHAFVERVAFYRSKTGGSLSIEEAREKAFHPCTDTEEAKKALNMMLSFSVDNLNFVDLLELHSLAPRVAEQFWERVKQQARMEFESGHLAANITFPVGYMKGMWNIARYLGVRESFIEEWQPRGGLEISLIDMLTQTYFQWQYWLEQTVKRSRTPERTEHPEYSQWMAHRQAEYRAKGWIDGGYWFRPYVDEQQAVEHAVQTADRWNRIFMRTLRQLRDLRRYSPVTINNPNQVNVATDGGQQINVSKEENEKQGKITS